MLTQNTPLPHFRKLSLCGGADILQTHATVKRCLCFQFGKPKSLNQCEVRCGLVVSRRGRTPLLCRHVQNSWDLTMGTRVNGYQGYFCLGQSDPRFHHYPIPRSRLNTVLPAHPYATNKTKLDKPPWKNGQHQLPTHALNYKPRGRRDRGRPRKRWQCVDAGRGQTT